MKIFYEKYDDTVQYLGEDKVPGWKPTRENIAVEIFDEDLRLTTTYENGLVASKKMSFIEKSNDRVIAQHLDENMGITIFAQNTKESDEATLTLINHDYIVGRYLRKVEPAPGSHSGSTDNKVRQ